MQRHRLVLSAFIIFFLSFTVFVLIKLVFQEDKLVAFTTDGCSYFPDGTFQHDTLWQNCCTLHDLAYWQGGSFAEKLKADNELKQCVTDVGHNAIGQLMALGVIIGGSAYLPTSFRWGYGWPYLKQYGALSLDEEKQVNLLKPKLNLENSLPKE